MISANRSEPRILLALVATVLLAAACSRRPADSRTGEGGANRSVVTALGRVTPGRSIISVAAQRDSRVLQLEAVEGKKVVAGEILATLGTHPLKMTESDAAKVALEEAQERLEAETIYGEAMVEQSRQTVRLLELARDHEHKELKRISSLTSGQAAPEKRLDDQQFLVATREAELAKASAELRAAEAALARARSLVGIKTAEAQVKVAEAELELSTIRAPIDGEILKVFTYPGERISEDPILQMGDTSDMHVIAEVRETDIGAVRVGQRATITSPALPEPLEGRVEEVGRLIIRNNVLDPDPRADKDSRVLEVRVKLDNPEGAAGFARLEVSVRIETAPAEGAAMSAHQ